MRRTDKFHRPSVQLRSVSFTSIDFSSTLAERVTSIVIHAARIRPREDFLPRPPRRDKCKKRYSHRMGSNKLRATLSRPFRRSSAPDPVQLSFYERTIVLQRGERGLVARALTVRQIRLNLRPSCSVQSGKVNIKQKRRSSNCKATALYGRPSWNYFVTLARSCAR